MSPLPKQDRSRRVLVAAAVVLHILSLTQPAFAQIYSWISSTGGTTWTPGDWSPFGLPRAGDTATFGPVAAYNVFWPATTDSVPIDTVAALNVTAGRPRFNIGDVLGIRGQVIVDGESLTVLSNLMRVGHFLVGSGSSGHLLLTGSTTALVSADSTFGDFLGDGGLGNVWVNGGARLRSNGWIDMAFSHTDVCTTTVIGGNFLQHIFSGLQTLSALGGGLRGDLIVGDSGNAVLQIANGGFVNLAGDLFVGRSSPGVGFVHQYLTGIGTPSLTVQGQTYVSANDLGVGRTPGTGTVLIEKGFLSLAGACHIGAGTAPGVMTIRNAAGLGATAVTLVSPNVVSASKLNVDGSGTAATISSSLTVGTGSSTGFGATSANVDSGATLNFTGLTPISVGWDGQLEVGTGGAGSITSSAELDVIGQTVVRTTLQAPLVRTLTQQGHLGSVDVAGTIHARMLIADSTNLSAFKVGAQPSLVTVGDSTASDGFVSHGLTWVLDDTVQVLDSDMADLGSVTMGSGPVGGTLRLLHGGRLSAPDSLLGFGTVNGSLTNGGKIRLISQPLTMNGHLTQLTGQTTGTGFLIMGPGDSLTARGTIAPSVVISSTLDLGPRPARLATGTLIFAPSSSTRIRIGSRSSGLQDTLVGTGPDTLTGTLDLRTLASTPPVAGDTLTILTAPSVAGTFSSVTLDGQSPSGSVNVIYGPTSVRVAVLQNLTAVSPDDGASGARARTLRFSGSGTPARPAFALDLPQAAHVRVSVFDVTGRRLAVLQDGALAAGSYRFEPRGAVGASSGVYFGRADVSVDGTPRVLTARVVRVR